MADEPGTSPTPRPRRRRSDIDPTFVPPKVANERRRPKKAAAAASTPDEAPAAAVSTGAVQPDDAATTAPAGDAAAAATIDARDAAVEPAPTDLAAAGAASEGAAATLPWSPSVVAAGIATGTEPAPGAAVGEAWLPLLDERSPNPSTCPFLRAMGGEGTLGLPIEGADPANRCAALREAVPQSLRQQELVCLTSGHVDCPRYLRGATAVTEVPAPVVSSGRTVTPAVLASIAVLVLAFSASIAFVLARGGLDLTAVAPPEPSASASVVAAVPSPSPTLVATPSPTIGPAPTPSPSPAPTPAPTPTLSPTPTPEPTPKPTPTPASTSDRYALLVACPNTPKCWIYTVRSGDNLVSIANYFGVKLSAVYDRNPWLRDSGLRRGQELRLPPPTR